MNWNEEVIKYFYNKGYRIIDGKLFDETLTLKNGKVRNGYMCYGTRLYGKNVHLKYHKLLAYHLFGDSIFEDGILVRHFNGNNLDNSPENIKLGTALDNYYDMTSEQREKGITVLNSMNDKCVEINRVFDDETVIKILKDRENGYTYSELSEKYNTRKSTLSYFFNECQYVKSLIN